MDKSFIAVPIKSGLDKATVLVEVKYLPPTYMLGSRLKCTVYIGYTRDGITEYHAKRYTKTYPFPYENTNPYVDCARKAASNLAYFDEKVEVL